MISLAFIPAYVTATPQKQEKTHYGVIGTALFFNVTAPIEAKVGEPFLISFKFQVRYDIRDYSIELSRNNASGIFSYF